MYRTAGNTPLPPPSPLYLRASIGGVDALAGVSVAPDISTKKLQGAMTFANPGAGEQPLLLVDSTVMGSGKAGMLVTDRAVYFDNPRTRLPLESVIYAPRAPTERGRTGTLATAEGIVPLPDMLEECAVAMRRALRAIALHNRGAARFAWAPAPVLGPVGEAAMRLLRHERIGTVPSVRARAMNAAANVSPVWLDHGAGEELLAFHDETGDEDGSRFLAFTDRRVIAFGDENVEVPYAALQGVAVKTGMLTSDLVLTVPGRTISLNTIVPAEGARAMAGFLQALGAFPPEHRRAWPGPPAEPTDPTGAIAALRSIAWPDVRVAGLLEILHAAVAAGHMPPESGTDLVARATCLQRTLRGGHGRTGEAQRSALSAADLAFAFGEILGAPVSVGSVPGGYAATHVMSGQRGSAVGTIASNVVGLTLLAVVGFGWMSSGRSASVPVNVRIWEAPGGAAFQLLDERGEPLAKDHAKLAGGVLDALAQITAPLLLRRSVYGWQAPTAAVLAEPAEAVEARVRALVPHADVAPFVSE